MKKKYIAVSIALLTLIPALYACECCEHSLQTEIVNEEIFELESWMLVPFDTYIMEEELALESWMTVPFNSYFIEEEVPLECWMTVPFEISPTEEAAELEC